MRPVLALEDEYLDRLARQIGFAARGAWAHGLAPGEGRRDLDG
jgi:hypothetical protein